jgi:microcystin-dependent protein
MGTNENGAQETPGGAVPARKGRDKDYKAAAPDVNMHANMAASAGGNQAHENRPPHLAINFIIALQGIYPSRN